MELNAPPWAWIQTPAPHHRAYAERGLWEGRTIADLAIERATEDPDFILFAEGDREISRAELLAEAEALSVALGDLGLVKGDVVSLQTPNWIEAAVINLAATMSGFIINPIVPIYRDAEVGMMLSDCRAPTSWGSPCRASPPARAPRPTPGR